MIKRLFESYGTFVSNHAVKVIVAVITVNCALGVGILNLTTETRVEESYYPLDTQAREDQSRVKVLFPDLSGTNFHTLQAPTLGIWARVIIKSNDGNLLNRTILEEISKLKNIITSIETAATNGSVLSYSDICAVTLGSCAIDGMVFFNSEFLASVDAGNVTFPSFVFSNGRSVDYQLSIGGKVDSNGTHMRGMEYIKIEFWFRTDIPKEIVTTWCESFLDVMAGYSTNAFQIAYAHYKSLDEELAENVAGDIGLFSITMTIMITYSCIAVLSARISDQIGQRMFLGYGGLAAAGLAILSAFGFCSAIGIKFVSIVGVVPFLIVGIGIDDMFILLSGLSEAQGPERTVAEKISKAMSTSGVGITITSVTDLIAFMAGAGSYFLSVRNFCIYTGVAVVFCYINNITLFCACMVIHERRVETGRHFATCMKIKQKNDIADHQKQSTSFTFCCTGLPPPRSREEAESFLDKFPRWLLPKIVLKTPIKVIICILFLGYLGAAIYGCVNLKQGLELSELVNEESYYFKYSTWNQMYFKRQTPVSFVIDSPYSYSDLKVQDNLDNLVNNAKATAYIDDTFSVNWLQDYKASTYYDKTNESSFVDGVQLFLSDARFSRYQNDLVIDTAMKTITASRIYLLSVDLHDSQVEGEFMLETRRIAKDASISCFAFHPAFLAFEQYVSILSQTLQSVGIAVASVFVVMCVFIPSPRMILFSTIAVTMIMVGLFGFMIYLDIALSAITMIHLIMSVGFSVDFTAHICHGYMISDDETRDNRVKSAIDKTGAPIFHGAVSSILGIAVLFIAKSYIFRTFAIVMILVLLFGICHSIFLLPVILSWFGPKGTMCSFCNSNRKSGCVCPLDCDTKMEINDSSELNTNMALRGSETNLPMETLTNEDRQATKDAERSKELSEKPRSEEYKNKAYTNDTEQPYERSKEGEKSGERSGNKSQRGIVNMSTEAPTNADTQATKATERSKEACEKPRSEECKQEVSTNDTKQPCERSMEGKEKEKSVERSEIKTQRGREIISSKTSTNGDKQATKATERSKEASEKPRSEEYKKEASTNDTDQPCKRSKVGEKLGERSEIKTHRGRENISMKTPTYGDKQETKDTERPKEASKKQLGEEYKKEASTTL